MAVQADMKYEATVKDAYMTESKTKGTAGLFFSFDTEDGPIDHTFYITPSTAERLKENLFQCFGISPAELNDVSFLEKISNRVRGDKVQITTKEDEYNGDVRVVVQWMNPVGFGAKRVEHTGLKRIAGIFGGGPVSSPAYSNRNEPPPAFNQGITDDDVPF